ncbi:Glutamate--cysteine ligase (Gamma-ECS) (GCS) (Gamma-glutamylcysteine synthetase) [Durusdinium trenchii]|uniref:Glutamate--cysteine ligase n=1 Tax=Durusdinium trenchii TaxID=1381693 RepID=A0ABP0N980_9DINO
MLEHCNYIRRHGVLQFLSIYRRMQHLENDPFFYGDELEYSLLKLNPNKTVQLSLRGPEVMDRLRGQEQEPGAWGKHGERLRLAPRIWKLDAGGDAQAMSLVGVEQNMRLRRGRLLSALHADEVAPTLVAFPLMGVGPSFAATSTDSRSIAESSSVPDEVINPHPRFGTLTANIRQRRGSKVDIRMPLFQDLRTPEFESTEHPTIDMDCMAYGMGCCCLQVTFQASNMKESRYLYDQLAVLAPIMMAMTAATPVLKGRLAATDARWSVISQSVDDRTPAERGLEPGAPDPRMAGHGVRRQSKSRYDSISCYIHPSSQAYNDIPCEIDEEIRALLEDEGVDQALAQHIAHLFTRDPLVAFEGLIEADDEKSTDHFESVQSTNWQTVRWKPPPAKEGCAPHIGWRTEFRSMEIQLTDFENAAFTAFMVLIARAIVVFNLDFLTALSLVDANMARAHTEDAVRTQKFWFRKSVESEEDEVCEMSMDEIMRLDHVIRPESFKLHDLESGAGETMSYYNPYTPYTFVELCTSFAECR